MSYQHERTSILLEVINHEAHLFMVEAGHDEDLFKDAGVDGLGYI